MQKKIAFSLVVLFVILFSFPAQSWGTMSSTNYTIFADNIDAGGVLSTSGTLALEDTVGESPVDTVSSTTYQVLGGYQYMDWGVITLDINSSAVNLGDLTSASVSSSSVVLSVSTSATGGYVLSVGNVSGSVLTSVADGSVTAGQEEYGIGLEGADRAFVNDQGVTAGLQLAVSTTPVSSALTTVIFKASIGASTASGARSQTVIFSASSNI